MLRLSRCVADALTRVPPLPHLPIKQIDYKGLVSVVEAMSPEQFQQLDLEKLLAQYSS
jgi:hypothetical protein